MVLLTLEWKKEELKEEIHLSEFESSYLAIEFWPWRTMYELDINQHNDRVNVVAPDDENDDDDVMTIVKDL